MNSKSKIALAVFVKTPGLSPLKTRLGASIGSDNAEMFHKLSCLAIQECLSHVPSISPFWAIAESAGLNHLMWKSFPTIHQGDGTLGERLHFVFSKLKKTHDFVMVMGADSPQITSDLLTLATQAHVDFDHVLGPTEDGGYYLYGGKVPLPKEAWLNVPYSTTDTSTVFLNNLSTFGKTFKLPTLFDVDTIEDLHSFSKLVDRQHIFTKSQLELLAWVKNILKK